MKLLQKLITFFLYIYKQKSSHIHKVSYINSWHTTAWLPIFRQGTTQAWALPNRPICFPISPYIFFKISHIFFLFSSFFFHFLMYFLFFLIMPIFLSFFLPPHISSFFSRLTFQYFDHDIFFSTCFKKIKAFYRNKMYYEEYNKYSN